MDIQDIMVEALFLNEEGYMKALLSGRAYWVEPIVKDYDYLFRKYDSHDGEPLMVFSHYEGNKAYFDCYNYKEYFWRAIKVGTLCVHIEHSEEGDAISVHDLFIQKEIESPAEYRNYIVEVDRLCARHKEEKIYWECEPVEIPFFKGVYCNINYFKGFKKSGEDIVGMGSYWG